MRSCNDGDATPRPLTATHPMNTLPPTLRIANTAAVLDGPYGAVTRQAALSGPEGTVAVTQVRRVLRQAWRASRLVECVNSVARMQQARHRRMTCGLLALKRLYGNCRTFRSGRRRGQTPYGLLGIGWPTQDWWELLRLPPEQLRQQLSAPGAAA
jgi:hypothetical protein